MKQLPLAGIRVVDMTVVWAGPFGSALLADMGAEVIKIDMVDHLDVNSRGQNFTPEALREHGGDPAPDAKPWNMSVNFNTLGRNKKSVTIDLTRPKGREAFYRLIEKSDVFIENNNQEVIDKLCIGYDVLRRHNPGLVMISLPGFGASGPYKYFRAYGANMEAVAGHTLLRGYTDADVSNNTGVFLADAAAGAGFVVAVLSALYARRTTGLGQFIDMAQAENFLHLLSQGIMDYSMNGRVNGTIGNRHVSRSLQGVYRCKGDDAWVAISCDSDEEFAALCNVIGRPELINDADFEDSLGRYEHQDQLDPIVEAWTQTQTSYRAFHAVQRAGVPAAPVLTIPEVSEDPHLWARDNWQRVTHPAAGSYWQLKPPIHHMSGTPLEMKPAPLLGQDNAYIYKKLCGYSDEEYQWFLDNGYAGTAVLSEAEKTSVHATTS